MASSKISGNAGPEAIQLRDRVHPHNVSSSNTSVNEQAFDSRSTNNSVDVDVSGHEEYLDGGFGWVIVGCR
jgi:hypothetical protein